MRSDPGRPARVLMAVEAWPDDRSPSDGVFLRDQARALAPHLVLGVAIGKTCSPRQWLRRGPTPTRNAVIREEGFCVFRAECFVATTRSRRLLSSGRVRALARAAEGFERLFGPPELIHAHGAAFAGEAALEVARRRGIPVVITEHYSFVDELLRTYGPRLLDVYEAADVLLVPSAEQSRRLRELGVCRAIRVRHNAVDAGLFAFEPIAPPAPGESWRILTVTRDHEVKDVPLLMDALGRLAARGVPLDVRVVGPGEFHRARAMSGGLGLGDRVRFVGEVPRAEVARQMGRCHLAVCSSRIETFGMSLAEALCAGRPVVATDCGGPREIIGPTDGRLVATGDPEALADAIAEVLAGYRSFDQAGIARSARARFGFEPFARAMIAEYAAAARPADDRSGRGRRRQVPRPTADPMAECVEPVRSCPGVAAASPA